MRGCQYFEAPGGKPVHTGSFVPFAATSCPWLSQAFFSTTHSPSLPPSPLPQHDRAPLPWICAPSTAPQTSFPARGTDGRGCGLDGAAPWSCSAATGTLGPPPRARPMPPSELTCRPSRAPQNSTVHHGGPPRSFPCRFHYRSAILPSKLLFSSVDCDRTKGTRDRNKNTCECGWVRVRVTRARAGRRVGMAGGYKPMGVKSIAFLAENALPITILCVFHPIPNYLTGGSNVRDKMSSIWMRKVFQIIQSL
jgi:hypothetical protein